jgi:GTPase
VVNKTDTADPELLAAEFHALGLGEPIPISAAQGRGVKDLMEQVLDASERGRSHPGRSRPGEGGDGIRVAVVGRPNAGKSTLINRLLGEERVVTFDEPGTTRDSIFIPFELHGRRYTLIDTAGVRRRARVRTPSRSSASSRPCRPSRRATW